MNPFDRSSVQIEEPQNEMNDPLADTNRTYQIARKICKKIKIVHESHILHYSHRFGGPHIGVVPQFVTSVRNLCILQRHAKNCLMASVRQSRKCGHLHIK